MGHLFRPRPWPSFKYHSVAGSPEKRCSCISSQAHEVSWFNHWLVQLLFRKVVSFQVFCCELIHMEEVFSFQSVEISQYRPDDPRLLLWLPTSADSLGKILVQGIPCNGTPHAFFKVMAERYRVIMEQNSDQGHGHCLSSIRRPFSCSYNGHHFHYMSNF
ncbi:hypothetical protein VPH35_037319 [Triticum aestivum]